MTQPDSIVAPSNKPNIKSDERSIGQHLRLLQGQEIGPERGRSMANDRRADGVMWLSVTARETRWATPGLALRPGWSMLA